MTVATTGWVERDGLLLSPSLTALGLVAGFTTRALGSMAGGVYPLVFDLWAANAQQLAQAGVRTIERADLCTQSGGADVWSHRAQAGRNGTGLGIIGRPR